MMSKVTIIGGGIIGLMSAYYLSKHKFEITIIDNTDLESTCSVGNAGLIVPSHFVPLSSPGIISKGIRWMFNSESPFGFKPSLDFDLLSWIWRFYKKSNHNHLIYSEKPLLDLNLFSKELYQDLYKDDNFDFELQEKGIINLCKTEETANYEINLAEKAIRLGLNVQILNNEEIKNVEKCKVDAIVGILYKSDAHLTPNKLISQLIQYLKRQNVKFRLNSEVKDFTLNGSKINGIVYEDRCQDVDEVILAAGAFSGKLVKRLQIKLPVQDGKGYSITISKPELKPQLPSILMEAKVAVTPMGTDLRIAGTMEIGTHNYSTNFKKVRGIINSIPDYYPDIKIKMPKDEEVWSGLRPCSPDGLPFIGKSERYDNLTIATGHSMMGLSLGPVTGKLVQEILMQLNPSLDLSPFNPDRYN